MATIQHYTGNASKCTKKNKWRERKKCVRFGKKIKTFSRHRKCSDINMIHQGC